MQQNFIEQTGIKDLVIINPRVFGDKRGYFFESCNEQVLKANGLDYRFVQDNEAGSTYGVLRGLHFQRPPYAQAKLVRMLEGEVLDVVVDLRNNSETYGQSYSVLLSAENRKQLLVPRGFAHGYVVLSETAVFFYKCDNYYFKEQEGGVAYNDPDLQIDWKLPAEDFLISDKDQQWKPLKETDHGF